MKKRRLRDIEVSEVGMGCMAFSHGYGQIPEESYSLEAIRRARDFGCTFFDTAESYGKVLYYEGHNEEIVGKAVKLFGFLCAEDEWDLAQDMLTGLEGALGIVVMGQVGRGDIDGIDITV